MLAAHTNLRVRQAEQALAPHVAHVGQTIKPHVNRTVLVLGLAYPMAMMPQMYNVWALHRTSGLSELTYTAGIIMAIAWTVYGLVNRDKAIFMLNMLWIGVHTTMLVGLLR